MTVKPITIVTGKGKIKQRLLITADEGMILKAPDGSYWNCATVTSTEGWTEEVQPPDYEELDT